MSTPSPYGSSDQHRDATTPVNPYATPAANEEFALPYAMPGDAHAGGAVSARGGGASVSEEPELYKTNKLTRVLAWLSAAWGASALMVALFAAESPSDIPGMLVMAAAFLVPAGWWFYCDITDTRAVRAYKEQRQRHEELAPLLGVEDTLILDGMGTPTPPTPINRHWSWVIGLTVVISVALFSIVPAPTPVE